MNRLKAILLVIGLITFNNVLGHYGPPFSIFFTAFAVGISTALIAKTSFSIFTRVVLIIASLLVNDVLVKLTAGGIHDLEGAGWINLFFLITAIITSIVAFGLLINDKKQLIYKIFIVSLIPLISLIYLLYFDFLGLTYTANESRSRAVSIKNKVFLKDLKFSNNSIISEPDSVSILSGWAEKQVIINHQHLIKRYDDSTEVNYIIKLASKDFKNTTINYHANDTSIDGSSPIDSLISFTCPKSTNAVTITFFKMTDRISKDTIIKTVTIR